MLPKLHTSLLPTFLFIAVTAPLSLLAQATIHVPADQPTIQAGINAANNGDTVLVSPGTYFENINFNGKGITVTGIPVAGAADPNTILDGSSKAPAVTFNSGETSTSVLSFLTIQHGGSPALANPYAAATAGISILDSAPTISSNTLTNNICWSIEADHSAPLIQGNSISGTQGGNCFHGGGSAIYLNGDQSLRSGGTAPAHVIGNLIFNNVQSGLDMADDGDGGGAGIQAAGSGIIQDNVIHDNTTFTTGGGISVLDSTGMTILQNLIYSNTANCGGGGIALPSSGIGPNVVLLISNNTIFNNTSGGGGDICVPSAQIYSSPETYYDNGPEIIIVNNILSGSSPSSAVNCAGPDSPSEAEQAIFDHNILHNVGANFFGPACVDVSAKYGNLSADPKLVNPTGGDFHLAPGSPAIDAGNNSALQLITPLSGSQLTLDAGNNPRLQDTTGKGYPIIDIGAYEYSGSIETSPTTALLTFSSYSGQPGGGYTLTATLKSALGTPTGTVTFVLDGSELGTSNLANGVATLSGFSLGPGVHNLYATYPGQGVFTPALSIVNIIQIFLISTTVTYLYTPEHPFVGDPIVFTIHSSAADGSVPSPITLHDNSTNTLLATLHPDSTGVATFTTSTLTQGGHEIVAAYAGTSLYAMASDSHLVEVGGYPTSTTLTCGPLTTVPLGASVPLAATVTSSDGLPTGSVSFTLHGTVLATVPLSNGMADFTYVANLAGYNSLIANYIPTPTPPSPFAPSSGSCAVTTLPLVLTSSQNPAPAYSSITFTATLNEQPTPTGTYTLSIDGGAPFAMTPSPDGTSATYTTSSLGPPSHTLVATFTPSGSTNSVSYSLIQQITAPAGDFSFTGPSTISVRTESTGSATLNLTSLFNFSGSVAFTCNLPLPVTYKCTLAPTSVSLDPGGTATTIVTLAPALIHNASTRPNTIARTFLASLLPLTLLAAFTRRRRVTLSRLLPLAILTILAASLTACGSDIFITATQPGSYPFTVTATGTTKGATTPSTHTLNITLVLTP